MSAAGLTLLAIAIRIPFIGMAVASPDTGDYLDRAQLIVRGIDLPDAFRTPLFPLLLAAFEELGTEPISSVGVMQNLIGMVMPAVVLVVGWRYFGAAVGLTAGFLTAAAPLLILTEQLALTDYLFGVILFIGAAIFVEAVLRTRTGQPARGWLIAAGAVFGVATLMRGNGQYAFVAIPLALLLVHGIRNWRTALASAAVPVVAMIAVISPWVIHNMISYGTPQVTTLGGIALYVRVIDHDRRPPPSDTPEGEVALRTYNNTYAYAPPDKELNSGLILSGVLIHEGMDNVEVSSTMMRLSLEAIAEDPGLYFDKTLTILDEYRTMYNPYNDPTGDNIDRVRNDFAQLGPGIGIHGREGTLPGDSQVTRGPWGVAQVVGRVIYLLSLGGFLALALSFFGPLRSRVAATVLLTLVIGGFLVGALTEHFEIRYDMPYAMMVWILLAAAATTVARLAFFASRSVAQGGSRQEVTSRFLEQANQLRRG